MSELRWILGLIGVVVVAALYIWGRRRAGSRDGRGGTDRVEPMMDGTAASESEIQTPVLRTGAETWSADSQIEIRTESGPEEEAVRGTDSGDSGGEGDSQGKILVLYIRAASGEDFKGPQLLEAFEKEGLKFGKLGAFHLYDESGNSLFSVANMHEPGSFAPDQMDDFETGGVIAFMVLKEDGNVDSLSRMIATARRLASILGGEVLDETGSTLTNQLATHMKEQAIEYLRRIRLEAADSTGSWRS